MTVTGEVLLFKNDFGFSTSISSRNKEGQYEYMPMSVMFRKDDVEAQRIPTKTRINIKNGFLSFYHSTDGSKKVRIIIMEYEVLDGNKPKPTQSAQNDDPFDDMQVVEDYSDGDFPF